MTKPTRPTRKGAHFSVLASHTDRWLTNPKYDKALAKAIEWAEVPECNCVEIFKGGKPFQSWRRNEITGNWDFHFRGKLIGETR